jgi:tyrosine-protein kinase Etk/Wzc
MEQPKFTINALDIISYAWKKRVILLLVSIVAFVASIFISLAITPMFKSQVVMFPAAQVPVAKSLIGVSETEDILAFGEEEEAERLLQILNSDNIRSTIIEKHNLLSHYEIDSSAKYPLTELYSLYESNISARRTQYMAIEIEVFDHDPHKAAAIANDIAALVDSVVHDMQKERAIMAFELVEAEYIKTQAELSEINDSLAMLGELGVVDFTSQAEGLNTSYGEAILNNNSRAIKRINEERSILAEFGSNYLNMMFRLEYQTKQLTEMQAMYSQAKLNKEQSLSHIFIIDKAFAAEKKAKPKRSIIVVLSTFSAFVLALLLLLVVDSVKGRL